MLAGCVLLVFVRRGYVRVVEMGGKCSRSYTYSGKTREQMVSRWGLEISGGFCKQQRHGEKRRGSSGYSTVACVDIGKSRNAAMT